MDEIFEEITHLLKPYGLFEKDLRDLNSFFDEIDTELQDRVQGAYYEGYQRGRSDAVERRQ